jgi:DNA modification methylase
MNPESPLKNFDWSQVENPDFKEDSVREIIILPLLNALGYKDNNPHRIIRSRSLQHPFLTIGSQTRPLTLIPDYILNVDQQAVFVLDAKAPGEIIHTGKHLEQVYSYAIHPEIRAPYFGLCNGRELIVFSIDRKTALLYIQLSELTQHWEALQNLLAPPAFGPRIHPTQARPRPDFDYMALRPLPEITTLKKQSVDRHYGVHPYFTRQVWNVVQDYIKHFTQPGDLVLDPFGGSGVTLIESLVLGRGGIHVDINPLSIFMVENLLRPVNLGELHEAFEKLKKQFTSKAPQTPEEISTALAKYPYPRLKLPKNSDVETVDQLFSPKQLAQLAYLKHLIKKVKPPDTQACLLLMFSGLLNKINLTYHPSAGRSEGRGDSAIFRYYRYRLAKEPVELDIWYWFEQRYKKVTAAKREIATVLSPELLQRAQIIRGTAAKLPELADESVDYIYTDPPYGSKIPYLDLSTLWFAWLDLPIRPEDFQQEAIEGGELHKTKADYADLLAQSIEEMYRKLKVNRWMSFVFAHKDPAYWHIIVETAEKMGFQYVNAVRQSNNKTSFKKRQNPFTVLNGQLIINFKKVYTPKAMIRYNLGANIAEVILETIESVIAKNDGATLEEINDEIIIKGLELGFLDVLARQYSDLTPILESQFRYFSSTQRYHLRENTGFKTHLDTQLRIKYFLVAYLRRMNNQHIHPSTDDIILNIMPLLKNGLTPEAQTILNVLEAVAVRADYDQWQLKDTLQMRLL